MKTLRELNHDVYASAGAVLHASKRAELLAIHGYPTGQIEYEERYATSLTRRFQTQYAAAVGDRG